MRHWTWMVAALGGCGSQIGTEGTVGCLVDSTEPVTDGSATPDGFTTSVDAMVAGVVGTFDGTLTHPDDTTADLSLVVTQDGDPVVERRSWRDDGGSGGVELAIGTDCTDDVSVPVTVTLTSGTALAETVTGVVLVGPGGDGAFYASIVLGDLQGDASPLGFDPSTMVKTTFQITATSAADAWTGDLSFQGESAPTSSGPDGTVSATNDPWATFTTTRASASP